MLMREKVWIPFMDALVKNRIKAYHACQVVTSHNQRDLQCMTTLPQGPWEEVSVHLASVDGETLPIVVHDYSRYSLVEPVTTILSGVIFPKLHQISSMFGMPAIVKSDNGLPFNRKEFSRFAETLGFRHRKVTPYWPKANGEVECFVKTAKKVSKLHYSCCYWCCIILTKRCELTCLFKPGLIFASKHHIHQEVCQASS